MTIAELDCAEKLAERLTKGLDMLMARERAGQIDATYQTWLKGWTNLLAEYISLELS